MPQLEGMLKKWCLIMWCLLAFSYSSSSPFPFYFSLVFFCFLFFFIIIIFFYFSFSFFLLFFSFSSKAELTSPLNQDSLWYGWNLWRDSHHPPPHLGFCVKAKCAIAGSPFECVPSPKSIRCIFDAAPMFSSIVCPLFFSIST
jgi:hypothetical protein